MVNYVVPHRKYYNFYQDQDRKSVVVQQEGFSHPYLTVTGMLVHYKTSQHM